jgi:hypothetical protein
MKVAANEPGVLADCPKSLDVLGREEPRHLHRRDRDDPESRRERRGGRAGWPPRLRQSIELVTVDSAIVKKAEQQIESCEHCHPDDAEIPFDWLLAAVTGRRRRCRIRFERTGALQEV